MDLIKAFNRIRDTPYRIPLTLSEKDDCCSGKSDRLISILQKHGYRARPRICVFRWNQLPIPRKLLKVPHESECTHEYVELFLNNKWIVLDATWDKKLSKVFHINKWNGKSDTRIAVKPIKTYSPAKSQSLVIEGAQKSEIKKDLQKNGEFYMAFNAWLVSARV